MAAGCGFIFFLRTLSAMSFARQSLRCTRSLRQVALPFGAKAKAPATAVRNYSSELPKGGKDSSVMYVSAALLAAALGSAYVMRDDLKHYLAGDLAGEANAKSANQGIESKKDDKAEKATASNPSSKDGLPSINDYQQVYNRIAESFEKDPNYDAGSYAPVCLRLAWHSSGTYDKESNTGGSNGATMRFPTEANHAANAGLEHGRKFLEPFKKEFPWISYSDLWTLGGVAAVQEMGGPPIPWRPGREDHEEKQSPPDGRLPDGAKDATHLRHVFHRLGFNDKELVALAGAHALGQCHRDRSGFDGPWTFAPTMFTNQFYTELLEKEWKPRKWDGPFQYQDDSKELMMLPTDYSLFTDSTFKKHVQFYAENEDAFFKDFGKAFTTLLELGVPKQLFEKAAKGLGTNEPIRFKTTADQENTKESK